MVESGDSKLYWAVAVFTYFKAPPEGAVVTSATKETVALLLAAIVGIEIPVVGVADVSGILLTITELDLKVKPEGRVSV
ncbi:hypothetical protein, partial [Clostridium botulinum]|uniref:hypothetical protein n=1 Tax=Clostridium botulinum TaxID=1491 RepID=UPI001E480580